MKEWHQSQRGYFAGYLYNAMIDDPKIVVVTADLGFGIFDKIREDFPDRFINVGASEMAGVGIACGLALESRIPFFYTITSFLLRAAETINIYLHNEQVPVKLVGSGIDNSYQHDGYSHNCTMAQRYLEMLDIELFYPKDKEDVPGMLDDILKNNKPSFIGLRR